MDSSCAGESGGVGAVSMEDPSTLSKVLMEAVEKCSKGETQEYNSITKRLSTVQMESEEMLRWLQALSACVPAFTRTHDQLLAATLKLLWFKKSEDVVRVYIEFLALLLTAHVELLSSVLAHLTQQLWGVRPAEVAAGDDGGGGDDGGRRALENVHAAIKAVLGHAPTAPSMLLPLVRKGYPFMGRGAEIQEVALRNALYMTVYCPSLKEDILEIVIQQILSIDVQLPCPEASEEWDYFGSEEDSDMDEEESGSEGEEEGVARVANLEYEGEDGMVVDPYCRSGSAMPPPSSSPPPSLPQSPLDFPPTVPLGLHYGRRPVMKNQLAEKMDVMVATCLQYLHSACHQTSSSSHCPEGGLKLEESKALLRCLLSIFERVVLPTHACSCVQFLLFHLASFHEDLSKIFVDFLWKKFKDPQTPAITKRRVAAYLGSFVARAESISLKTLMKSVSSISRWIHKYMENTSPEHLKPDLQKHGPFYSLCQTLFYIFSFHHLTLLRMRGGVEYLRKLKFERIITSQLNPLKVCLPWVVERFASLACRHEVAFSYTILEQNKRLVLPVGCVCRETNSLDCYFPFDPLLLVRSWEFIKQSYRVWKERAHVDSVDEDDSMMDDIGV